MPKTVFVLGAGASVPYKYPSGAQLRTDICKKFVDDYEPLLSESLIPEQEIEVAKDFVDTFNKSGTESIDLFLSRNSSDPGN